MFLFYLQRNHPFVFKTYDSNRLESSSATKPSQANPRFERHTTLTTICRLLGKKFIGLIVNYIVGSFAPLSVVENPSFINLVAGE
jgi:hypothetical protein